MITFKAAYARGMDGASRVCEFVDAAQTNLPMHGYHAASDGIDLALALACNNAKDAQEAADHLEYVIRELSKARANIGSGK